jgi:hypothetical protein
MMEIKFDEKQINNFLEQLSYDRSELGDAIRDISNFDGHKSNAFIGIAQGLESIAEAIRLHTEYLKDRDEGL